MKQYIFATRSDIELIDLNATLEAVNKAVEFLKGVRAKGGIILWVATQPAASRAVLNLTEKFKYPYVVSRWLGGTLTNFKVINKRLEYFKKLREDKETGKLEKYTKKEQLRINQNIAKMNRVFEGLESLMRVPDALFTVNINVHDTAVREAKRLKIPVVAIIGTDADPKSVDYPIPANDNAKSSIEWILDKIGKELEGVSQQPQPQQPQSQPQQQNA